LLIAAIRKYKAKRPPI